MRISDWSSDVCSSDLRREDIDQLTPLALAELHLDVGHGEEGVVAAAAQALTGVELGAALAHEDGASGVGGAVAGRHAEALCCGDRTHDVVGKSVSVRVDLGGSRYITKKKVTLNKCIDKKN